MIKVTVTDKPAVSSFKLDGLGFARATARFARTGIQEYAAHEIGLTDGDPTRRVKIWRDPDDVFAADAIESFRAVPVTDDHPPELVTAGNADKFTVGWSGDAVTRDGDHLVGTITIMKRDVIDKVLAGKVELSAGYTVDLDLTPGRTADGIDFDGRQTNIRGNHIAIVAAGRCGQTCRIGDSCGCGCNGSATDMNQVVTPQLVTVTIDGISIQATDQAAQAIAKLTKALDDSRAAADTASKAHVAEVAALKADHSKALGALDAEIAALKAKVPDANALDTLAADRVSLIGVAKTILGQTFDAKGKSNDAIRREVVTKQLGDVAGKDDAYIRAAFDVIARSTETTDDVREAFRGGALVTGDQREKAYGEMVDNLQNAWKTPAAKH